MTEHKTNECLISYDNQKWTDNAPQLNVAVTFYKEFVEKVTKNAWKKYAKMVNMKGFRNGKMPRAAVEKMVGQLNIYSDILSNLANVKFLESHPNKIIFTDKHEIEKLPSGEYAVKFVAWEEPKVTMDDAVIAKTEFDIKDKFDIDRYVNSRVEAFAKLNPYLRAKVDDKGTPLPSAKDDMVEVYVDCLANGKKFIDGCEKATNIRLLEGTVNPPEMYDMLLNRVPGDEFSLITQNIPKAFLNDLSGKTIELHVKVNHVYTCEEAVVNDDIAITRGHKSLEEWKAALKDEANRLKDNFDRMAEKQAVLTHLMSATTITPFPPGWISIKSMELKVKDPQAGAKIEEVAKQISILKYVGEKIGVEWEDADRKSFERDESMYAQKVLDALVQRSKFNHADR